MATTFLQDLATAMVASLDVFIAANPTLMRRSELAQPPSVMGDFPLAFVDVDTNPERIHFDAQTMDRVVTAAIVVVWPMADNVETVTRARILRDAFVDHCNINSTSFVTNSSWTDLTIGSEDYPVASDDGSVRHFYATRFTFVVSLMEGRA